MELSRYAEIRDYISKLITERYLVKTALLDKAVKRLRRSVEYEQHMVETITVSNQVRQVFNDMVYKGEIKFTPRMPLKLNVKPTTHPSEKTI